MQLEVVRGRAVRLSVEDEVDPSLPEKLDILRAMSPGAAEPEMAKNVSEFLSGSLVHRELNELDAIEDGRRRQSASAGLRFCEDQRAQPIDCRRSGRCGAEIVIEHLER